MEAFWQKAIHPEMIHLYLWFFAGFVAVYALAALFFPRKGNPPRGKTKEGLAYRRTLTLLWLHLASGVILGSWRYWSWYSTRNLDQMPWDCWPLATVYLICLFIDLYLIGFVFGPPYRIYRRVPSAN